MHEKRNIEQIRKDLAQLVPKEFKNIAYHISAL